MGESAGVSEVKRIDTSQKTKDRQVNPPANAANVSSITSAEDNKKLKTVRSRLLGFFRKVPASEIQHDQESTSTGIQITYEGGEKDQKPFITVDQQKLVQALTESGYSPNVLCSLTINQQKSGTLGTMAHYNSFTKRVEVYEYAVMDFLKKLRAREYAYIDGERVNNVDVFLDRAKFLLNPFTTPYALLRNEGAVHDFAGDDERKRAYMKAAASGFTVKKDGEVIQLSSEESKARAKAFMDQLIQKAAPHIIGWIIAHEYEHRNKVAIKLSTKLGATLGPFLLSFGYMQANTGNLSHQAMEVGLSGAVIATLIGTTASRRYDENASYEKADKFYRKFADAVSIDTNIFSTEIQKNKLS